MSNEKYTDILLTEYKMAQEMHNYYGKITWEIGSIILGGGVAAFGFIVSEIKRPNMALLFFAVIFTIMMIFFILSVKRWREISEVHLARCRQIETELKMQQHRLVYEAGLHSVEIRWGDKKEEIRNIKIPRPTSWNMLLIMSIVIIVLFWIVAIYFATPFDPL